MGSENSARCESLSEDCQKKMEGKDEPADLLTSVGHVQVLYIKLYYIIQSTNYMLQGGYRISHLGTACNFSEWFFRENCQVVSPEPGKPGGRGRDNLVCQI